MMYSNFFPAHEDSGTPFAIAKSLPLVTLINSINIKSSDTGNFEKMIFLVTTPQKSQIW